MCRVESRREYCIGAFEKRVFSYALLILHVTSARQSASDPSRTVNLLGVAVVRRHHPAERERDATRRARSRWSTRGNHHAAGARGGWCSPVKARETDEKSVREQRTCKRAGRGRSVARHATTRTHLLNVIIANRLAVVELLPAKDEALLLWWNALLVLREGIGVNTCM